MSRVEWGTGRVPRRTCLPVELGWTTTLLGFGGCCPTPGKGERPPPGLLSAPRASLASNLAQHVLGWKRTVPASRGPG